MKLADIARASAEDAGMLLEVSVVARDARDYPLIERLLTTNRVREHLGDLVQRTVVRYAQPHLGALIFVLWPTLPDTDAISAVLLDMEMLPPPAAWPGFSERSDRLPVY